MLTDVFQAPIISLSPSAKTIKLAREGKLPGHVLVPMLLVSATIR